MQADNADAGYGKNWNPVTFYKDRQVARSYDDERFRSLPGRVFSALEKRLVRKAFAGLPGGAVIGDVPCGTGRLSETLLGSGHTVLGVDVSPEMLDVARAKLARFGDRFSTTVCDARKLSENGVSFDAALCARVLMHFPLEEQIEFLRGVVKATKGRVVFTQGLDTPFHRARRSLKVLIGNQPPAVCTRSPGRSCASSSEERACGSCGATQCSRQ